MFTLEAEAKLLEAKVVEEDEEDGSVTTFFEFRRKSAAFELPTALPELTFSDWLNLASVSELELSLLLGTVVVVVVVVVTFPPLMLVSVFAFLFEPLLEM